jgi:hypothetical protein
MIREGRMKSTKVKKSRNTSDEKLAEDFSTIMIIPIPTITISSADFVTNIFNELIIEICRACL